MSKRQFCTFWIAERLFGVDILDVKEVNPEIEFTPIFHAPEEVRGYVNIRGRIHLVLDLRLLLGFETRMPDEESRVVLFKPRVGESFGILVDRIGDVVDIDECRIEDHRKEKRTHSESNTPRSSELWSGVCKMEEGLLVILNSRNLLKNIGAA